MRLENITAKEKQDINEEKIVNEIRALGLDMIMEAGSGHPGIVLGAAPIIYTLFAHHLKFNALEPKFYNRDRFVLSSGHGSALYYALLALAGYDISLDDLKSFRKLDSKTPGHPEYNLDLGIEISTGPLGQGFASAVGMALAEKHTASLINKTTEVIDYNVYCLCGDGDLMEGISYEAASLAGCLNLSNLIVLYDDNHVSLDSDTKDVFIDDVTKRFESISWEVIEVTDEIGEINNAITKAKESTKPVLIRVKTTIGKYSRSEGTNKIHGGVLTLDEVTYIKEKLGVRDIPFTVTNDVLNDFQYLITSRNENIVSKYEEAKEKLTLEELKTLDDLTNSDKTISLVELLYDISSDTLESLRQVMSKTLNSYAEGSNLIIGGAADVAGSTLTEVNSSYISRDNYEGKNIHFGVREHAMAAIANGLALSGYRPFVSTYLSFADYLKPALRLSALMNLPVLYIFTHDSFTVGEDGPTHQPVEQLVSLRAVPNIDVLRPADTNEVIGSFKAIYEEMTPTCLIIPRGKVEILKTTSIPNVKDGAYIVHHEERQLDGIIISTGEEVALSIEVANHLKEKGYDLRVISMPSTYRYKKLDQEKQEELLPVGVRKFVIERSSSYSWYDFAYSDAYLFSQDEFGKSGSRESLDELFGFTKENLSLKIEELLK